MYTEPSTPTVMRITSSLRLSRMRLMTAASPAEHMCAARVDTLSQARRTRSQSAAEGRSPRVRRMLEICLRSPESLRGGGAGRASLEAPGPSQPVAHRRLPSPRPGRALGAGKGSGSVSDGQWPGRSSSVSPGPPR